MILDKLKKHGFNVLKNSGKEGLLESVSIANERRDSGGVLNLANNTAIAIGDIFEGNEAVKKRVRTAIEEEAKRSLLLPEMEVLIGK